MNITEAFEEIMQYAHFWNWVPDWQVTKEIYEAFPNSYSVLSPFAYSYLEELIRSTTSEYGREVFDENGNPVKNRKVGMKLINLAITENNEKNPDYIKILEEIKKYYYNSKITDEGENRHSVAHGYMHPRFWSQESFEKLIKDIAILSSHARF
jgi:hypothetical protein